MSVKKNITGEIQGSFWFCAGGADRITERRIHLLEEIGNTGSISQAAKNVGLSYKAAWDAVSEMNNTSDRELVMRSTGGKGGGGATLSEDAKKMVESYRLIEAEHKKFLESIGKVSGDLNSLGSFLKRTALRTSARNQFYGKIEEIKKGPVSSEISIRLKGDDEIVALVTNDSVRDLSLKKGIGVYALIKSTSILLTPDSHIATSARNILCGRVVAIDASSINCLISLKLKGGTILSASITRESMDKLSVREGETLCALFKASEVILGVE